MANDDTNTVWLPPVVRFREFPFGFRGDPSMRDAMAPEPWQNQDKVLEYLRSGLVLGVTMGADLADWFDRPNKANPIINGEFEGGTTCMTDGTWFWYAGLIYFIEKYNVRVPEEFIRHAERNGWRVDTSKIPPATYDCSYLMPTPVPQEAQK